MPSCIRVAVCTVFLLLGCAASGTHIQPQPIVSAPAKEVYVPQAVKPKTQDKLNKNKALLPWLIILGLISIAAYSLKPVLPNRKKKPARKK